MTAVGEPVVRAVGVRAVLGSGPAAVSAVDGVDLEVRPGEMVALMGPSGSGKTTLLSLLASLLTPTEGRVELDGVDPAALPPGRRARLRAGRVGLVFQTANLVPYLTAEQNVALAAELAGVARRRARRLAVQRLEEVGLGARLRHRPAALSGGERQRVALARALVAEPAVLLADEPTASLDSERAGQILGLLADACRGGGRRAGVVATHDERVLAHADRVLRLRDGRLHAEG